MSSQILPTLFYAAVLLCAVLEMYTVYNPSSVVEVEALVISELEPVTLRDKWLIAGYKLYQLICWIGLFTQSWEWFAILLVMGYGKEILDKSIRRTPTFMRVDSAICVAILVFILLNFLNDQHGDFIAAVAATL